MDVLGIVTRLEKKYPRSKITLTHRNAVQLLIAVMLSAQCTDKMVNNVTEKLFKKYKTMHDFARAKRHFLEREIHSTGFYRNKAKNIIAVCKIIEKKYNGRVPRTMSELTALPGVGRKTANIVLDNAYSIVDGIAVDTHVKRVSYRLGLTKSKNPDKIEKDLMSALPKGKWSNITNVFIDHGRAVCKAPVPRCNACFLKSVCPKQGVAKYV